MHHFHGSRTVRGQSPSYFVPHSEKPYREGVFDLNVPNAQAADTNRRCSLLWVDANETGKHNFRVQSKLPEPFLNQGLSIFLRVFIP